MDLASEPRSNDGIPTTGAGRRLRERDMDYATFTRTTAERAGVPEETAERIEHVTLRTLADRISGGEAQDLAAQLPARLQDDLRPPREEAGAFGGGEFGRRVAERGSRSGRGPDRGRRRRDHGAGGSHARGVRRRP